ncbi:MAG: SDR family oxidoreductase [Acidobacteriota bacterium]|nr:SDR family oxidoreductase [Acidobacteriota bacterium]
MLFSQVMALYLVTGAAGFIGSSLVRALLATGEQVRGLDNFATGKPENLAGVESQIDFRESDILDLDALHSAMESVDYVLHQAALGSVPRSIDDPVRSNRVNVEGTLQVLVAARDAKVKRLVYASSSSVYGDTPTLPKREDMPPNPISPYSVSKLAAELYAGTFYRVYGLPTVCLRYFNIFGPRQLWDSQYSAVLARFITRMLRGESPTIFGDGEQSRDFTYVGSAVSANLLAATAPVGEVAGRVFNIASGTRISLNHAVTAMKELTGYDGPIQYGPDRAGDVKHALADITLAKHHLRYAPTVSFEEGLKRTVAWYVEHAQAQTVKA